MILIKVDYELVKEDWLSRTGESEYIHIRQERPDEHFAIEEITREAHWVDNWEAEPCICDVHLLVHRLRKSASYVPELHFVAEMDGKPVGHIMYAKSKIIDSEGKEHEMLTFGPLSVLPAEQNKGIGKALMRHSFAKAQELGYRAVLIFGHPDYYPRAGFRRAAEFGITTADGKNFDPFMAYPLYEGALDGIRGRYILDPVYEDLSEEDVAAFDKKFPPKELHIPVPIEVLLDRLPLSAQKALEEFKGKSLKFLTTKSEREISSMDGIDSQAIKIIRTVTEENGMNWGTKTLTY